MEHLDHRKKVTIMVAIMAAMLFAALNQTIVGTALPKIVAELGGFEYYSWVFTIFMLTSSITAVLVGKLSDIYGRKPFILIGIGVFMAGSLMAGFSQSMIQLIIFRGIQGFGGGMIMSTAFTAVGDLFSPRERGRWQGILSSVFGLASVFGPTFGGWIVDNANWQWVFWVFLPFGIVAFLCIISLFPSTPKKQSESVDYLGSILLTAVIVPLLLAFTWAGTTYDWGSVQIIGLFALTVISLGLFIWAEKKVKSPVMPLELFKNRIFTLSNAAGFILGVGMFGAVMYVPFFIQGVMGVSAAVSGLIMMPMTLSMVAASSITGSFITKTGKYKVFALTGLAIMAAGMFSLSMMNSDTSIAIAVINNIIVGTGLGMSFPIFTLTVQNAVSHQHLGVATAASQLFRQTGGTIGVAIMGLVLNNSMHRAERPEIPEGLPADNVQGLMNPQALMDHAKLDKVLASVPPQYQDAITKLIDSVKETLQNGLSGIFLICAGIILLGFILTFFLKEIPLRTSNSDAPAEQETEKQKAAVE
ncbi:DHA2 family efflux MFS transporter permease subunit [Bacillus mangrovi]|uniref:DHA2 family efflux MFS transporter permease subunit n=1 Tax=Metabacillus mangrovi TaxID=1491830 RepID=A0A7X2S2M9_9BACI|nr:MDR family MFS transporter [Metabacillus mangrovi]MTH52058.1 DHA2 family efflux MFS transporter permease subunit [Metabacillus mangrovi]